MRKFFGAIALVALIPLVLSMFYSGEKVFRYSGMLLQLLGIGAVILGILKTREFFGQPSPQQMLANWVSQKFPSRNVKESSGRATGMVIGHAYAQKRVAWKSEASLEEKVSTLKQNFDEIDKDATHFVGEFRQKHGQFDQALSREREERTNNDNRISDGLKNVQLGGLNISAVGAVWLFFGVILGSIPNELADLIKL